MKNRVKNALESAGAIFFEVTSFLLTAFPPALRRIAVIFLGYIFGQTALSMRKNLQINLSEILNVPKKDLNSLSNRIFRNFALTLMDFFFPGHFSLEIPDRQKLNQARDIGKGVLVLTFHMGNWELGARTMRQWGWPVTAVYQPYRNKRFKHVIESRRAPGVNFIPVGGAAANGVRQALRRGDVVAMLGDLPFGEEGAPVNLLGHQVIWPKGPIVLAVRQQAPIVVAVIIRTGKASYKAVIEDPLIPQSKAKAEIDRLVQAVADKFGKLVTQYSDQWYRFKPLKFVKEEKSQKKNVNVQMVA